MPFTGAATIKKLSDSLYRITGLSLAPAATGTISLAEGAGQVEIVGTGWTPYASEGTHGGEVTLNESIQVTVDVAEAGLAVTEPVSIVKAGTVPSNFLVTLANPDAAASGALEIYVRFH